MFPQIVCLRGCIVTLVAFVGLFSTVYFQMCPQITCPRGCMACLACFPILCFCYHWISYIGFASLLKILIHHVHLVLSLAGSLVLNWGKIVTKKCICMGRRQKGMLDSSSHCNSLNQPTDYYHISWFLTVPRQLCRLHCLLWLLEMTTNTKRRKTSISLNSRTRLLGWQG